MMMLRYLALFLVLCVSFILATETVTEFKKMRVRQLKEWMRERGLSCPKCTDKEGLVQFCTNAAATGAKIVRPKVPEGVTFWDAWAKNAKEICEEQVKKRSLGQQGHEVCAAIEVATDHIFMQYGKRTANKLRKKSDVLLKTSYGDIYFKAGRRIFTKFAKHCLSAAHINSCSSVSMLQGLMEKEKVAGAPVVTYITNVGIENTNPMYEILKDKKGIFDEEL